MNKKKTIVIAGVSLVIIVGAAGGLVYYNNQQNEKREELSTVIQTNFSEIEKQRSDKYYPTEKDSEFEELKELANKYADDRNIAGLEEIKQKSDDLDSDIQNQIKKYDQQYLDLNNNISNSEMLLSNYFAKDLDIRQLKEDIENAKKVLENSKFKEYESTLSTLKTSSGLIDNKIRSKKAEIVSTETNFDEEYPFAVEDKYFNDEKNWDFQPLVKQTKVNPDFIYKHEPDHLDETGYFNLFTGGGSQRYDYKFKNIPTKEITVETSNRTKKKALVNTEINFKAQYNENDSNLKERPAYFFVDKNNNNIYLAIQNFEDDSYYMLYSYSVY